VLLTNLRYFLNVHFAHSCIKHILKVKHNNICKNCHTNLWYLFPGKVYTLCFFIKVTCTHFKVCYYSFCHNISMIEQMHFISGKYCPKRKSSNALKRSTYVRLNSKGIILYYTQMHVYKSITKPISSCSTHLLVFLSVLFR
jgi:hypothetical protein